MIGADIVALAESWIGTPYRHQGATKGVACDCIGLIRWVWRELYGCEPPLSVPPYAPDWAERAGEERLLQAALTLFGAPVPKAEMQAGDVLLFRWHAGCAAKHAGILADETSFIHAYEQVAVTRSALVPAWRRRIVAVHRFGVVPEKSRLRV
ncbi:NlpC/P60 family protein [Rhizobium sp. FKY42]|uniref:NlpC/P60 family protein n=1 Tax=Rhizobium sp. FKY42 TaxID=2562310 RepID=UPI0010BF6E2B|nr:NlpC/P60 family protein [Rhizobium sp. FKY42]